MNKRLISKVKGFHLTSITALVVAYIVIFATFSFLSPYFLSWKNMQSILKFSSTMGIVATGMTFVICAGSLELSAGTIAALVGVMVAYFMKNILDNAILALMFGMVIGLLCGTLNTIFITVVKINPFITTLATQNIFKGVAYIMSGGLAIPIRNKGFIAIAQTRVFGFPLIAIYFLLIIILLGLVLKHTKFGRCVYSVGGNAETSFLAGISLRKTRATIYVLSSALASVSGILNASLTATGQPSAFTDTAMDAISAVILGGCALSGGKGSMLGTFIGVIVYATLSNGMTLLSIPSFYQMVLKGIILIFAVTIDVLKGSGGYK